MNRKAGALKQQVDAQTYKAQDAYQPGAFSSEVNRRLEVLQAGAAEGDILLFNDQGKVERLLPCATPPFFNWFSVPDPSRT